MKDIGKKERRRREEWKLKNGVHNTEHSTGKQCDNFDNIVLGIIDRREGDLFYFMGVLYNSKLDFIDCFDVVCAVGLDNEMLIFY